MFKDGNEKLIKEFGVPTKDNRNIQQNSNFNDSRVSQSKLKTEALKALNPFN